MTPCQYDETRVQHGGGVIQTGAAKAGAFHVDGLTFYSTCPNTKEEADKINETMSRLEGMWEFSVAAMEESERPKEWWEL
jgi:hypothetical protein